MWKLLIFSLRRSIVRFLFLLLWCILLLFFWWQSLEQKNEKSLLFLIDNSLSMSVRDISTSDGTELVSRLEVAKIFAKNIVEKNFYNMAVATFSRNMTLETPFTNDKFLVKNVISGIEPLVYGGGSDIFLALEWVISMYKNRPNTHIVVLTDAEIFDSDFKNISLPAYMSMTFVGIGTEQGGLILEGYTADGQPSYRQFEGKNVISRLDKNFLEKLSEYFSSKNFIISDVSQISVIEENLLQIFSNSYKNYNFFSIFGVIFLLIWVFFSVYIPVKNE